MVKQWIVKNFMRHAGEVKIPVLCTCYWCQCHCRQKQEHKRHTAETRMYPPSQPSPCFWRAVARGTLFSGASQSCFFVSVAWSGWNCEKSHITSKTQVGNSNIHSSMCFGCKILCISNALCMLLIAHYTRINISDSPFSASTPWPWSRP